jgi:VIT1/CCC1 family predicted Fe2+/Mn2+ transporter
MEQTPPALGRPDAGVGHYLRDIVYGASDGVVTTTAVIAGAAGAAFEPRVGIVLGIANLVADGLSMGASNYLGLKSELEQRGASVSEEAPWRHGVVTVLAFAVAGAVPLLSYAAVGLSERARFALGLFLAFVVLAVVGGARSLFLHSGVVRCAAEMVVVAGGASGAAYLLGRVIAPWLN